MNTKSLFILLLVVISLTLIGCTTNIYEDFTDATGFTEQDIVLAENIIDKLQKGNSNFNDEEAALIDTISDKYFNDIYLNDYEQEIADLLGLDDSTTYLPDRTIFTAPLPNIDNAVILLGSPSKVSVAFRNNKGVGITIPRVGTFTSPQCTNGKIFLVESNGLEVLKEQTISNGEPFIITWTCDSTANSGDPVYIYIEFDYMNVETGQKLTHMGTIDSKFP